MIQINRNSQYYSNNKRTGKAVPTSTIHTILKNRIYMGEFEWNGEIFAGSHQPLVARELWNKVQEVLAGRNAKKTRRVKHDFAFSGLIQCGHCGCAVVGDIKKQRYVYYRCSGYHGKCPEPYVREEVLEERFSELLDNLIFDDEVLEWVRDALHASHAQQREDHGASIKRLRAEYDRLEGRIHQAYVDKLDGRIDAELFDRFSNEWRAEQARCQGDIQRHESADGSYLTEGVRIIELAQNAKRLFDARQPHEKRRLLDTLLSNCLWKGGRLTAEYKQPFDSIVAANENAARVAALRGPSSAKDEVWLGERDSNPHWRSQSPLSYH
jgi:site-specific DNA recombinase